MLCWFSVQLLMAVFNNWKHYVHLRREDKAQLMECDVHYTWTLMTKCFRKWTDYVDLKQWKHEAAELAAAQYR